MTDAINEMTGFSLGRPSLVCRWRLSGGTLPLANRHIRALRSRCLDGKRVSPELAAWAKQQVEWSLEVGASEHPDGVLMLIVDEDGRAAMTVGPYAPLQQRSLYDLAVRATDAGREAQATMVPPEVLIVIQDGGLLIDLPPEQRMPAVLALVSDLAKTLGMPVRRAEGLAMSVLMGETVAGEAALISDEHGVVVATDRGGSLIDRFAAGYAKLLEKARA